mgnify:CR=1 FL=1
MNSLPFGQLKSFLKILIGVQYDKPGGSGKSAPSMYLLLDDLAELLGGGGNRVADDGGSLVCLGGGLLQSDLLGKVAVQHTLQSTFSIPTRIEAVCCQGNNPKICKKNAPAPEAAPVGGVGEGEIRFWVPPLFLRLPIFLFHRVLQRVLPAGGHTAP